jgi:hypothetical protein
MSDLEKWAAIVAFAMPLLIAILERQSYSEEARRLVAFGACVVAAFVTTYLNIGWAAIVAAPVSVLISVIYIAIGAWGSYHLLWKPIGVAPAVERTILP